MKLLFDSKKNLYNIAQHGLDFKDVSQLEWNTAVTKVDNRFNYGEERFITYAMIGKCLHCLIWTMRDDDIRPISFRKANIKERKRYEKDKKT